MNSLPKWQKGVRKRYTPRRPLVAAEAEAGEGDAKECGRGGLTLGTYTVPHREKTAIWSAGFCSR
jgi:hypothetical protein